MKKSKLKLMKYVFIVATVFLYGCAANHESDFVGNAKMEESYNYASPTGVGTSSEDIQSPDNEELEMSSSELSRKLIKQGTLRYQKDSLSLEVSNIKNTCRKLGGFISAENVKSEYHERSHFIQIKLTNDKFEDFINMLSNGVDSFDQKDIHVQDVTNDYFDLEARIASEKKIELRYQSLLNKANTIKEIIELEELISKKRVLIESFEGKIKQMERQTALSTISITVYKPILHTEYTYIPPTFGEKFIKALGNGWSVVLWVVIAMANIWPFYIVAIVLVVVLRQMSKRNKRKRQIV
ncbi:MAG: DUF4349 domain-containing protein, partial [Flavobacteriales bacterium]|nr:DUF4349 domain-containing protein [Flavobacteriales bacterium]